MNSVKFMSSRHWWYNDKNARLIVVDRGLNLIVHLSPRERTNTDMAQNQDNVSEWSDMATHILSVLV